VHLRPYITSIVEIPMPDTTISFSMAGDKEAIDEVSQEIKRHSDSKVKTGQVNQYAGEAQDLWNLASTIAPSVLPSVVTVLTALITRRNKHQIDSITIDGEKLDAKGVDAGDLRRLIDELKAKKAASSQ
jgi:hypothetical protein